MQSNFCNFPIFNSNSVLKTVDIDFINLYHLSIYLFDQNNPDRVIKVKKQPSYHERKDEDVMKPY